MIGHRCWLLKCGGKPIPYKIGNCLLLMLVQWLSKESFHWTLLGWVSRKTRLHGNGDESFISSSFLCKSDFQWSLLAAYINLPGHVIITKWTQLAYKTGIDLLQNMASGHIQKTDWPCILHGHSQWCYYYYWYIMSVVARFTWRINRGIDLGIRLLCNRSSH